MDHPPTKYGVEWSARKGFKYSSSEKRFQEIFLVKKEKRPIGRFSSFVYNRVIPALQDAYYVVKKTHFVCLPIARIMRRDHIAISALVGNVARRLPCHPGIDFRYVLRC